MYTVIRFIIKDPVILEKAKLIGAELNEIIPGVYEGMRKARDGFACSMSSNEDWMEHQQDLIGFILKIENSIVKAKAEGISIVVDISVDSDPSSLLNSYRFSGELLKKLVNYGIDLEMSVYGVETAKPNDSESKA